MKNWRRSFGILLVLAIALTACTGSDSTGLQGVQEGRQARDFGLQTVDGTDVSLSDFRGKVVLLNFWATWCPPCKAEIPDIQAAYEAHQEDGLVVLGINVEESRQAVEPFVRDNKITYPVLLDEAGEVKKIYRALGLPMSVVVDQEGVIRVRHIGVLTAAQLKEYLAQLLP